MPVIHITQFMVKLLKSLIRVLPMMKSFLEFISDFRIESGRYIPINSSRNEYRHYGTQTPIGLILNEEEICYLFNPDFEASERGILLYISLKNDGFNVFRFQDQTDKYFVYIKTTDFNKKKVLPVATSELVSKNDKIIAKLNFFHKKPILFLRK
ncbi:MAG: hypothetical protein O7C59_03725 [Rickettsia endosymbiont of Ixodes persulcatus]|nr:hypothetical protein [Rickettsia endosymbiont of Ixodes persulcatus]